MSYSEKEGKLYKQIREMREDWKKRKCKAVDEGLMIPNLQPEDVFKILDEAKTDAPKDNPDETWDDECPKWRDWFKKWFGVSK